MSGDRCTAVQGSRGKNGFRDKNRPPTARLRLTAAVMASRSRTNCSKWMRVLPAGSRGTTARPGTIPPAVAFSRSFVPFSVLRSTVVAAGCIYIVTTENRVTLYRTELQNTIIIIDYRKHEVYILSYWMVHLYIRVARGKISGGHWYKCRRREHRPLYVNIRSRNVCDSTPSPETNLETPTLLFVRLFAKSP